MIVVELMHVRKLFDGLLTEALSLGFVNSIFIYNLKILVNLFNK